MRTRTLGLLDDRALLFSLNDVTSFPDALNGRQRATTVPYYITTSPRPAFAGPHDGHVCSTTHSLWPPTIDLLGLLFVFLFPLPAALSFVFDLLRLDSSACGPRYTMTSYEFFSGFDVHDMAVNG
jgi:hypothetical protein